MLRIITIAIALCLMTSCTTYINLQETDTGFRMTTNAAQVRGTIETPDGIRATIDTKKSNVARDALMYILTAPGAAKIEATP